MALFIGFILSFGVGYGAFSFFSFRFGFHPSSWQTKGAEYFLKRVITECYTGNDSERTQFMVCAQKRFLPAVKRWGVRPLMEALEHRQLEQSDTRAITQCHDLSHAIGAAGVIASSNVNAVLPECTNTCVYGCQHGAVSSWYAMGKDVVGNLHDICMAGIDWSKNPQGRGGCFHELGHAVASVAGYDVVKALKYCDQVADVGRLDCGYGVFMELFEPATFATAPQPLPANHPAWCDTLWPPYKEFCFHQAGVNDFGRFQDDARAISICRRVPREYQLGCFRNLGTNIFYVYQYKEDQSNAIVRFCRQPGSTWFMSCISGALLSSVLSHTQATEGVRLCEALKGQERNDCFGILGAILDARRSKLEKADICDTASESDRLVCNNGRTDPYE